MTADLNAIRQHWDAQAALGEKAGTQDLIAKELEQRAILAALHFVPYGNGHALEVGCGRGETARLVADKYVAKSITAVDASAAMIAAAEPHQRVIFAVRDAFSLPTGQFDVVYTERCIINVAREGEPPTWEAQKQAIDAIADRLVSGGRYLMCEASQDGLDAINERRVSLGLSAIDAPWHNRYLRQHELCTVTSLRLRECINFSATYYYNSRIANAYQAKQWDESPMYDAALNQMSLKQPTDDVHPKYAQSRLWVWEKP